MQDEKDLKILLKGLKPTLNKGAYVFTTVTELEAISPEYVICQFQEKEGITRIVTKDQADLLGLKYSFVAAWITLEIHSSLNAVGLTATVATALTEHNISCNVVAAFYHDHLFVPIAKAQKTIEILKQLSKQ